MSAADPTGRPPPQSVPVTPLVPVGSPRPAGLPVLLSPLVGRERELGEVLALLRGEMRLLTLTGPGGVGKTRLALRAAAEAGDAMADGVAFVPLAAVRDPSLVLATIAQALGVRDDGIGPLEERLHQHVRRRQVLLVLDNAEHLLDAAPQIAAVLEAGPGLRVLVTSRAPLHVSGEVTFPVPPLALPDPEHVPTLANLARVEAVDLFVRRARAVDPGFALSEANARSVAEVCVRLDGLPLAIELAAARTAHLPVTAIVARLERRLSLLTDGPRDQPARLRGMRDAIAWSHDLLAPDEQVLFRRLAVFVGGVTLQAAEAIAGAAGTPEGETLEAVASLVDHSLLQTGEGPDGEPRYRMLETVREFGLEQLAVHGEAEETGRRHAEYFLALALAGAADGIRGGWLSRLEAEQGNLRAALAWCRDHEAGEAGLALAAALGPFWHVRSANAEGRAWLETFLAQAAPPSRRAADRIAALRWAGELAGLQGDLAPAMARLGESLALARRAGDRRGAAAALGALGSALFEHGDVAGSLAPLEEAAALSRELGDARRTGFLLAHLAYAVGLQGDLARAGALVAESEAVLRPLGDTPSFESNFLALMQGWLAIMRGEPDRAQERLGAALAVGRALGAKGNLSVCLAGLGEVALARGELETASQCYREGLAAGRDGDFPAGMIVNLQGLVRVGVRRADPLPAARLVGALEGFGAAIRPAAERRRRGVRGRRG